MTDINKEYEKEYYDEYRNNYYNPDDDDGEPGINLNWKRIQKGFHSVAGNDQETAETLSGMQENLETLNADVETLKTDVDDIKESINDLNTAVETAEQAAAAASASEAAAEAAQVAIEEIAESIPEDYSELSDDVSELKNVLKLEELITYEFNDIIQGSYSNSSTQPDKWVDNANRIRTAGMIPVYSGMVLSFTPGSNASYLLYGKFNTSKSLIADSQWVSTASDININWDGYIICVFKNGADGTTTISPSDYDAHLIFRSITDKSFDDVYKEIDDLETTIEKAVNVSINLMPTGEKTATYGNVGSTYDDGVLTLSGTANATGDGDVHRSDTITLAAGTYTFSIDNAIAQLSLRKNAATRVALLQGTTLSTTFTLTNETQVYLTAGVESGATYNGTVKIQIEKGSTAHMFVAPSYVTAVDNVARGEIEKIGYPYVDAELSWTSGKAFIYNSGWSNNSGWSYADVDLIQGQSLDITLHVATSVYALSLWNDDGTSIIRACFPLSSTEKDEHYVYACRAEHEKVRINVLNTYKTDVVAKIYMPVNQVNISNIASENNNFECYDVLHSNIIAIGDSLTQGSYTGNDLHTNQSYPAFLAKKMNSNVANAGRAGWTTLEWWTGDSTSKKGFPYYNYSDYDTAVICLGTNDGLTDTLSTDVDPYESYTDYADTNTGAYCKIIEGMKAQNSRINIILCNIWAGGGTDGVSVTNEVIGKIAERYSLQVVDLKSEFISSYGAYHAVQNNIHLGRIGYARMADLIRQALNNDVMMYPDRYNYIPD